MSGRLLSAGTEVIDAWTCAGAQQQGQCGRVRWRHNGQWLFGAVELDESTEGQGLQVLAERAYRDIFDTLRSTGCNHLQRLWNYLPGINADGGGLERYRQFNAGRQIAFLDAGYAAFEGAPAACAIGTRSGPFCVRFLAGTSAPVAVENPRQVSAYHYPTAYGPRSPTFSRAALMRPAPGTVGLLISGTASIVGHQTMHVGDVAAQTRETLANLQAVIGAAQARCSARFALSEMDCVVYVRQAEQAPLIRALFEAAVGAGSRAARSAVYVEADVCRADLLVEIEAHGFAAGEVRA
jgi:enamine deaminase RidA (YjgF/YER057c/UK114 family)